VSEALYLRDPDGNGVELYWDRPLAAWPRDEDDALKMFTRPLNLGGLIAEAEKAAGAMGSVSENDEILLP
jgi:catechol 2,3-dioxygenase